MKKILIIQKIEKYQIQILIIQTEIIPVQQFLI